MKSNAFNDFKIPTSFNVDIVKIDRIFQSLIKDESVSEDFKLNLTHSYSILRNNIARGEEILQIFNVNQESIELPQSFFEEVMEFNDKQLKELSMEIYEKINTMHITDESIDKFSTLFIMYKYITKAFLSKE